MSSLIKECYYHDKTYGIAQDCAGGAVHKLKGTQNGMTLERWYCTKCYGPVAITSFNGDLANIQKVSS